MITNELLAHMSYSCAVEKQSVREQLEKDIAEFLANGGEVKQIAKPVYVKKGVTAKDIKYLADWVKAKRGRGGKLCAEMGVAPGFISQISRQIRSCSVKEYERILKAIAAVEAGELM